MGRFKKGVLLAAFGTVAILGIKHFTSGSSQPAYTPTNLFNHYSTATGNDVALGFYQPAAGECPDAFVALKGTFTFAGKSGTHRITIDEITIKDLNTDTLYGFAVSPAAAQAINTAENTPGARLVVRITNGEPTAIGCYASTMTLAGVVTSASIARGPGA